MPNPLSFDKVSAKYRRTQSVRDAQRDNTPQAPSDTSTLLIVALGCFAMIVLALTVWGHQTSDLVHKYPISLAVLVPMAVWSVGYIFSLNK